MLTLRGWDWSVQRRDGIPAEITPTECNYTTFGRPCSMAVATACDREVTSSFEKILSTWNRIVRSDRPMILAISRSVSSLTQGATACELFGAVRKRARWMWYPKYSTSGTYRFASTRSAEANEQKVAIPHAESADPVVIPSPRPNSFAAAINSLCLSEHAVL